MVVETEEVCNYIIAARVGRGQLGLRTRTKIPCARMLAAPRPNNICIVYVLSTEPSV